MKKRSRVISMALSASIICSCLPVMALASEETNVALQLGSDGANTVGITASYLNASNSFPEAVFDGKSDDGSGVNKWYVPDGESSGAWINVDLNSVCTISSIKVYSGYGNTAATNDKLVSYDIYYSDKNVTDESSNDEYTLLASVEADHGLYEIDFEPISARNVKIVSTQDTAFRVREIEMFGTLGSDPGESDPGDENESERNVALNKQNVTGSFSRSDSGPVTAVTDGITDQATGDYKYFVAEGYSNGAWVNIDLEDEFLVSKVIVYSGYGNTASTSDRLTDFDICCTTDSVDDPSTAEYTTVYSAQNAEGKYEAVLDKPTLMRNVKILSNNTTQFRIREIEVIGMKAPELPEVAIVSPNEGTQIGVGSEFEISAQVTVQETELSEVTFYVDGQPLETTPSVTGDIYTVTSDVVTAGSHTIKVTAENVKGNVGESEEITIYAADYIIDSVEFENGAGESIDTLPAGDMVKASVRLSSYTNETLIAAYMGLYNINTDVLSKASCSKIDLSAGGTETVEIGMEDLPSDIENYCVKIFLWKGEDSMEPICEPVFFGYTKPTVGDVVLDRSEYKNHEDIICSVNASDPNADIEKVEFYVNGVADTNTVTVESGVYTANLGSRYSGEYTVYAKVTNYLGVSVESEPVTFMVTGYSYDPDEIILQVGQDGFDVYVKGSMSESAAYTRYHFEHIVNEDINADLYRVYQVFADLRTDDLVFEPMFGGGALISIGELECALNEVGAEDFVGGFHGDENLTQVSLTLDGEEIDLSETGYYTGKTLMFTQDSVMNRCNTPNDNIVQHGKQYTITKDGMVIDQDIEWLASVNLDHGYTAMLPVNRMSGNEQLTHKIQVIEPWDATVYDVPKKDETTSSIPLTKKQTNGVTKVRTWGEESGIEITLENIPDKVMPNSFFILMVRDNDNKMYFDYSGHHTTEVGEKWHNVSKYQITLSK